MVEGGPGFGIPGLRSLDLIPNGYREDLFDFRGYLKRSFLL